jgi:hypothetical protein
MSRLSEYGSELVHDTALYTYVVVLCALADAGKLEFVDTECEKLVERERECAFESR